MKLKQRGQILIVVAILLLVVLFFLAVIIDGARLMVEKHELNRAADAAARAGLGVIGDRMVTQVVVAQTAAALNLCTPIPEHNLLTPEYTPPPPCTPTPLPSDFYAWLKDHHRANLVSPAMQTSVAIQVHAYAENNNMGLSNPNVIELEVTYPYEHQLTDRDLNIYVRIRRQVTILFAGLLGIEQGELSGDTKQSIPQRK